MQNDSSPDVLCPVPLEKWPILLGKTNIEWPRYDYIHNWFQNAIRWKTKDPGLPIEVYKPRDDPSYDTFIGISHLSIYIAIVFTREANCESLKRVVKETQCIDWSQGVYFAGVHEDFLPNMVSVIDAMKDERNIDYYPLTPGHYYFKSAKESVCTELGVPNECYVKMLDKSHVPTIHAVWPHKDPERPDLSTKYLTVMIEMNGGVGLFLKEDDTLVSWALHTDWDGMGMVQTAADHMRKGYAKVVIKALADKLGREGTSTTLFIVDGNTPSVKLFEGLGFKRIAMVSWIVVKRPGEAVTPNHG